MPLANSLDPKVRKLRGARSYCGASRRRPSGLSVLRSKLRISIAPLISTVSTIRPSPIALESTLAPPGNNAANGRRRLYPSLALENTIADDPDHGGNCDKSGQARDDHQPAYFGDETRAFRVERFFVVSTANDSYLSISSTMTDKVTETVTNLRRGKRAHGSTACLPRILRRCRART